MKKLNKNIETGKTRSHELTMKAVIVPPEDLGVLKVRIETEEHIYEEWDLDDSSR